MNKNYASATINQAAIDADPELKNSGGNRFDTCVFEGEIVGINFSRAAFAANCDFTGGATPAEFINCNMIGLNPEGGGVDPSDEGATFTLCATGSLIQSVGRGTPLIRPRPLVPSVIAALDAIEAALTAGDTTPLRFLL